MESKTISAEGPADKRKSPGPGQEQEERRIKILEIRQEEVDSMLYFGVREDFFKEFPKAGALFLKFK